MFRQIPYSGSCPKVVYDAWKEEVRPEDLTIEEAFNHTLACQTLEEAGDDLDPELRQTLEQFVYDHE